ncbi:MAG: xanthine dehydrogenase family protein [Armatimonadetes bacterium]|nr:xanthine dehydrogenase family protein [Armatimonadota bacterium]
MKLKTVGQRVPRLDGPEKVTGRMQYGADLTLPGMVQAAVLRSPHAHARVVRVSTETAEHMPGVLAIVTGRDFPRADETGVPVIARERVRYAGEAVAAVAAETYQQAVEAAAAIEVTYKPLPAILDVREAITPDATHIHEDSEDPPYPNIAGVANIRRGDIAAGFAESDRIFEETFETRWVHQGFIEPHVSLAEVNPGSGRTTIWTSTQAQFNQRSDIAHVLGLPMSRLRVIGLPVGGAFGGKIALCVEPIVAELARRTGHPVKLVVSRKDDFVATRPCGAAVMQLKAGVKKDGTLVALQARLYFDTGGYPGAQHSNGAALVQGPYRWPHLDVKSWSVYTNRAPAGARRALAAPHVHFAIESMLDMIASALGRDGVEFRAKNAVREGDPITGSLGMPFTVAEKTIRAAARKAGWSQRRRGVIPGTTKSRGFGLAAGHWTTWAGGSAATVQINEDGTVSVVTGAINLTGTNTSFGQIAAESLGVPMSKVTVHQGDTDTSPRNDGTWNSRVTFGTGEAVRRAAEDAKRQLAEALAEELKAAPEDIEVVDGKVRVRKSRAKPLSLAEAAGRATEYRGALVGRGALSDLWPPAVPICAQIAEVEVDRETGQVQVTRLITALDVGRAINPMSVEGQIEGAASQGLGYALAEEYIYNEAGHLLNDNFMDFRMLTSLDHPTFESTLIEEARDSGPYGAKGVGEPPLIPTAAAVANAIYDAIGVRVTRLPVTPERIIRELSRA